MIVLEIFTAMPETNLLTQDCTGEEIGDNTAK